jgi:hypothetical protein
MKNFIEKNFISIVLVLSIIGLIKSCSDSREITKIKHEISKVNTEIQEIRQNTYTKDELNVELIIMGLEAEKRMIQATDRKLLDVRRQTEIEEEIKRLKRN